MIIRFFKYFCLCLTMLIPVMGLASVPVETLRIGGLKDEVIVSRDGRSIPYIAARNIEDMYFAQGFETARDRLWQMDLMRRVARGRLAELFGKSVLEEDKRWRKFGFSKVAEDTLSILNPDLRTALESYAKGVNAYIDTLDAKSMPAEFQILAYEPEKWKPTDTIVIGKILADGLSTTWWQDVNRLGLKGLSRPKYDSITSVETPDDVVLFGKDTERKAKSGSGAGNYSAADLKTLGQLIEDERRLRKVSLLRVGLYAEHLAASNNWVISGKRTADGKAIIANDPHLPPTAPGIWYLTHLSSPGHRVAGVTFPGVPGVVLGHNDRIAWGATNVGPDVQDVYFEEFNEKNEYLTATGWEKAKVRKEVMKYRPNPASPAMVNEVFEVLETRNGVVFNEVEGKKISLKWTAFSPVNQEFEAFIKLNSAVDWKGFRAALRTYGGAAQNFVFADTKGNIGWQVAGRIPTRRTGDGSEPYSGKTNDGDWTGYLGFEELPVLYNPPSGFIVTANQRIVGTAYKHPQLTRQFAGPWRARRIYGLISGNPKITMDDVRDIQHDTYNIPLSLFAREIVEKRAASDEVITTLKSWDGRMTADSKGAVVANAISACVGNEIARLNPPVSGWHLRQFILPYAIPAGDNLWLPGDYGDWSAFLRVCSEKALKGLSANDSLGEDSSKWRWGLLSKAEFSHPLASVPIIGARFRVVYDNVDGSGQTPNVGDSVSMRFIATPADWDNTRHVIPLGQSGDPGSAHWRDQFENWRTGKPALLYYSANAVRNAAKEILKMTPAD